MLRKALDRMAPQFEKGGRLQRWKPLFEAFDTFFYTPGKRTGSPAHIRDGLDMKRLMTTVVLALVPCIFMALYNTGYQANVALQSLGGQMPHTWRYAVLEALQLGCCPDFFWDNIVHGALYFIPVLMVTGIVGGFWEVLFSVVRGHEVNEGFFVTMFLFPLTLPPTVPLWQVAVGISFGVVFAKEVFGGTGMNILNPALAARAFLFFAYPMELSGDAVWVALDGFSAATPLTRLTEGSAAQWMDGLWGLIPGSMGETSALACLLGAGFLIITGVASLRIMLSVVAGMVLTLGTFQLHAGGDAQGALSIPAHLVYGGFAFGCVFMATDPVSAAMTTGGKYLYGLLIGMLTAVIRVVNPAFPEGMMLAILVGNIFAPIIDQGFLALYKARRRKRSAEV